MRTLILVVAILSLCFAGLATADIHNRIGVFSTPEPPDLGCLFVPAPQSCHTRLIAPTPGLYEVYVLAINPHNDRTGEPINMLGGFEFDLEVPAGWFIQAADLPACTIDFDSNNNSFYCGGQVPVDRSDPVVTVLLATITLGSFVDPPPAGYMHMAPYFRAPSLPDLMAVADAEDGFSLSAAIPSRIDFEEPVLAINITVIPAEDRAWGDVKALYR
ncbi:MAG: hypothetical protein GY838_00940 [bacterium]|nr:hypothetical protein [bacterium]